MTLRVSSRLRVASCAVVMSAESIVRGLSTEEEGKFQTPVEGPPLRMVGARPPSLANLGSTVNTWNVAEVW